MKMLCTIARVFDFKPRAMDVIRYIGQPGTVANEFFVKVGEDADDMSPGTLSGTSSISTQYHAPWPAEVRLNIGLLPAPVFAPVN